MNQQLATLNANKAEWAYRVDPSWHTVVGGPSAFDSRAQDPLGEAIKALLAVPFQTKMWMLDLRCTTLTIRFLCQKLFLTYDGATTAAKAKSWLSVHQAVHMVPEAALFIMAEDKKIFLHRALLPGVASDQVKALEQQVSQLQQTVDFEEKKKAADEQGLTFSTAAATAAHLPNDVVLSFTGDPRTWGTWGHAGFPSFTKLTLAKFEASLPDLQMLLTPGAPALSVAATAKLKNDRSGSIKKWLTIDSRWRQIVIYLRALLPACASMAFMTTASAIINHQLPLLQDADPPLEHTVAEASHKKPKLSHNEDALQTKYQ